MRLHGKETQAEKDERDRLLDSINWRILELLQENARLSYQEIGQRVGLSAPAVGERVRKLEDAGIIKGYHAHIDLPAVGLPVMAHIRLSSNSGLSCQKVVAAVQELPEVIMCMRVTGGDSAVVTVVATSVEHLERIIDQITVYGMPTTSLVLSKPLTRRVITQELVQQGMGDEV